MTRRLARFSVCAALASGALLVTSCEQGPPTAFAAPVNYSMGSQPSTLDLADVTGDGIDDALVGQAGYLMVRAGGLYGSFGSTVSYPFSNTAFPRSMSTGDLDSDGFVDVVAATGTKVERWEREGATLAAGTPLTAAANVVEIEDVTGDGRDDLLVLAWSSSLAIYPQMEDGTLGGPVFHPVPVAGYNDLDAGDIDGDGDTDVVVMSGQLNTAPNLTVLLQGTDGLLTSRGSWSVAGPHVNSHGVAIGNLDHDATAEIVLSLGLNTPSSKITVFEADATGALTESTTFDVIDTPTPVELADVNRDGHDDAVVGHSGFGRVSVLYGGPEGPTGPIQVLVAGSGVMYPDAMVATDLDGDGDTDIGLVTGNLGFTVLRNAGVPPATTTTTTAP